MTINTSLIFAAGRHVVSAVGGGLVVFGIMKATDVQALLDALNSISQGVAVIMTAVGVVMPIVSSIYAALSARFSTQKANVLAQPDVAKIVKTDGTVLTTPAQVTS